MSTLFTILLSSLASKSSDLRQVSARTLGDLVKKLGQRILPQIIPILEKGLESDRADERQGILIGFDIFLITLTNFFFLIYLRCLYRFK